MKHTLSIILAVVLLAGVSVPGICKDRKKSEPGQKIALGVWDDVNKKATVEEIVEWMKPFDEAGIKNYYMCGTPEETARYIEAAKSTKELKCMPGCSQ